MATVMLPDLMLNRRFHEQLCGKNVGKAHHLSKSLAKVGGERGIRTPDTAFDRITV
jgi:hypothetical protein